LETERQGMARQQRLPRTVNAALFITALTWAIAANLIATKAAQGISGRFQLAPILAVLQASFLLFLLVVGLRGLDWIATKGRFAGEVLPLPARKGRAREWGIGFALGWGMVLAGALPVLVAGYLHAQPELTGRNLGACAVALIVLALVSLAEEVIFRGYALQRLAGVIGISAGAVLMSVVFAAFLIFADPPRSLRNALIDGLLFGLLLTMAYLRTRGLWLGWGLHFGYRAVAAVIIGLPIAGHGELPSLMNTTTSGPRWLSGGAYGLDATLWAGAVLLIAMAVLYRVTREYAWSYTHAPIIAAGHEVTIAPPAAHVAMEKTAAPPPLVQILSSTPQTRSVVPVDPEQDMTGQ